MTLKQLEYVVALDTYRHFVTAAEKCFVTQPTITTQLKNLEEEIGLSIFDRSLQPMTPTDLGKVFIIKAKSILQETNDLKDLVNKELNSINGKYKIGVIPTVSPYIIPLISGSFSEKYPNTVIEIEELKTLDIIRALKNKEIDLGILVTPINESHIREIKLYNEPFVFYANKNHFLSDKKIISVADVEKLKDIWLLNSGNCFRTQVLNICPKSSEGKNIQFQSGSIEALKKMVDNYGGFTLVPELAITEENPGCYIHFSNPKPVREVSIVTHHSYSKQAFIDAIRTEILSIIPPNFEKNEHFIKVKWR